MKALEVVGIGILGAGLAVALSVKKVSVMVNPGIVYAAPGDEFSVSVDIVSDIASDTRVFAGAFVMKFDPSILEVADVSEGDLLNRYGTGTMASQGMKLYSFDNTAGTVRFSNSRMSTPYGIAGRGSMFVVKFRAKAKGSTKLELPEAKIADDSIKPVGLKTAGGRVVVG